MSKEPVKPFSSAQLTQLAHLLGDLQTGSELDRLMTEARLPASDVSTKWRRLRDSFEMEQARSRSGNGIARFVKLLVGPDSFIGNPEGHANIRAEVNKILGFSGLQLEEDGALLRVMQTRTVKESERRADRLRAKLQERGVHPDVIGFCRAELLEHNYFYAVFEASKSVFDKIRMRTGLREDGRKLIDRALSTSNPALMFNNLSTESERSEHSGLANYARGLCGASRNPPAHEPRAKWAVSEIDALDTLTIASMLHRRIDQARLAPGAPLWSANKQAA